MKSTLVLLFSLLGAGLFSGCSSPGVVQLSPDTYMITKEDHGGIFAFNRGKLKTDTIREANEFAESKGKIAVPVALKEHPVGVLGDWASVEYQFRVVDKNDPEAKRTSLVPRADVVIEKTERIAADVRTKDETEKRPDLYTEIMKLDDLRKKGLITDAEFEAQKQKLLATAK
jgi:hypothetical protein